MRKKLNKESIFLKEGFKNIRGVGTICSTSRFAAKAMAPEINASDKPKVIVELGVGTGSITKEILKHLRPKDCYIGIEANDKFLEVCKEWLCVGHPRTEKAEPRLGKSLAGLLFVNQSLCSWTNREQSSYDGNRNISVNFEHGLAQNIREILKKYGAKEVDEIICTIPFRILPKGDTKEILQNVKKSLKKNGHFTFIRYLLAPENKEISKELSDFSVVSKKIIMRNIPPAEVIKMRRG